MRIQRARAKIWLGRSLRQVVAAALLSVGVLFCLPGILIRGDPLYQGSEVVESCLLYTSQYRRWLEG